jgi:hypothetical protein
MKEGRGKKAEERSKKKGPAPDGVGPFLLISGWT